MSVKSNELEKIATAEETTGKVFVFSFAAIAGFLGLIIFLV